MGISAATCSEVLAGEARNWISKESWKQMREALDKMVLEAFKLPPALLDPTEPNQNRDLFRFKSFPEFPKYNSLIHFSDGEIVPLPMCEKYATELKNVQFKPSRNALERLRGWSPRTDDWQPTDQGEHMSLNANIVQQMMQPVIQAAFTAEQEKAQVQAQLDTVNGQLRSTQSELASEKSRARDLQSSLDYARDEKKGLQDRYNRDTQSLSRKVEEANEHHQTCGRQTSGTTRTGSGA
jgi:hypothetical protein